VNIDGICANEGRTSSSGALTAWGPCPAPRSAHTRSSPTSATASPHQGRRGQRPRDSSGLDPAVRLEGFCRIRPERDRVRGFWIDKYQACITTRSTSSAATSNKSTNPQSTQTRPTRAHAGVSSGPTYWTNGQDRDREPRRVANKATGTCRRLGRSSDEVLCGGPPRTCSGAESGSRRTG